MDKIAYMKSKTPALLQRPGFQKSKLLQWGVPLVLSASAIIFELVEHQVDGHIDINVSVVSELVIFGLLFPIVLFFIIAWMRLLVEAENQSRNKLDDLIKDLEQKVADRTATLEKRNLELANANAELMHLDEMKSEFVSMVSHELRTPLTILKGGFELIRQHAEFIPAPVSRTLEMMEGETERLKRKVQTILNISQLDAGKMEINLGPVALRPLMEKSANVILIPENRPIEWEFSESLPPVLADEVQLEEIVRNLMRNAVKYSPPNSKIYLCACQEEDKIKISVKDRGAGVPVEQQSYIFEKFSRGKWEGQDSSPQGWGLGLFFARKMINAQNGSIGVNSPAWLDDSVPGSEFYLILPVADISEV